MIFLHYYSKLWLILTFIASLTLLARIKSSYLYDFIKQITSEELYKQIETYQGDYWFLFLCLAAISASLRAYNINLASKK